MVSTTSVRRCDEKLDTAVLTAILASIRADRSVATLHLTNAGLTPSLVVQIADFLEQNATLTRVDLSNNPVGTHGASCLAASMANNSTLTSLSLAKCGLRNESLAPWIEFFQAKDLAAKKSVLTELNLSCNQFDEDSSERLTALIQAVQTPAVRLDFRKNQLCDVNMQQIASALESNTAIVGLRLEGNEGDEDATLKQHKQIEFYLRRNSKKQQRSETLIRINQIQHSALEVQVCHFDHVDLSIADADLIRTALCETRSVVELRLMSNALPAEGAKRIFSGLHASVSVRKLAVADNNIGDVGMRALSALLRENKVLQCVTISNSIHLTLANGLLQPITRRTASLLHHTLANYATIRSLSLANCGLSDRDIGVIVSGIAWSAQIQELDLKNNAFGDATAHVFVHMLHRCRLFCRLDLSNNRFTLPGTQPVVNAVSIHPSIRVLLLGRFSTDTPTPDSHEDLLTTICTTLQQSFSLVQLELLVFTSSSSRADAAKRHVAPLTELLQERNGASFAQQRSLRAHEDALHAHRSRFRALVRIEAERAAAQLCAIPSAI
ncbi:hypothetical protein Gpo141_00002142 [Globisporangium polare]